MFRPLFFALALVLALGASACRKRTKAAGTGGAEAVSADQSGSGASPVASPLADPQAAATPLPPPNSEITVAVERRFMPAQAMNAYAPAQPGDYQAQLALYNRVLRKRVQDLGNTPDSFQELMSSSGYPKPPQPPAGRNLVYDKRTVTVTLQ